MRTRRFFTRIVAAAFLLVAIQHLVVTPQLRAPAAMSQRAAKGAMAQKWQEAAPFRTVRVLLPAGPEAVAPIPAHNPDRIGASIAVRRFQRPPPAA